MKLLILSATTGGGHMRAANALKEYILSRDENAEIKIYDTINYVSPLLNKAVNKGYVYMAKNAPKLFGTFYRSSDNNTPINKTVELTMNGLRNRLLPMISDFKPDAVVTTHSFAAELFAALKKREELHIPIVSIVTDFAIHKTYINDGVDAYVVSSDEMIDQMVSRGVSREVCYPYGIPIKKEFLEKVDVRKAFEEEGLDPDKPTILIMAGSFGVTDVLKVYHKIVRSEADFQIILITGKNEKLYETFEKYLSKIDINNTMYDLREEFPDLKQHSSIRSSKNRKPSKPTKLLFFTDCVEKYMQMSDLIVTKPGGLTVTESIATGLPMGIFKAIPGQEEQNADYLVRNGMAVRIMKDKSCTKNITELIENPEKLQAMREVIAKCNKGNSCEKIYSLILRLSEKYKKSQDILY